VLDWDHNAYYHRLLLRQMPQRCRRVLDVGCGAGAFAARLARRSEQVDALDRSAEMIEEAKRRTPGNVSWVLAETSPPRQLTSGPVHPFTTGLFRPPRSCPGGILPVVRAILLRAQSGRGR
jgi:tRNA/tmRNA/rRNA uracil-C5-methylase (TrmA/RlmC/RlmD family)